MWIKSDNCQFSIRLSSINIAGRYGNKYIHEGRLKLLCGGKIEFKWGFGLWYFYLKTQNPPNPKIYAPFIIIQMKLCACISSYFKMRNIFLEWQQEWGLLLSILKVQTCSIIQASIGQAATLSQLGRKTQNFLQTWRTVKLCQKTWANQSWDKDKKDNNNTFQT